MAANHTTNYKLNQWLSADQVLRTDFNADNAKIDAALAGKAETETVSALQAAVAGKAEQANLSALEAQVNSMGIAKAEGTYTGDGGTQQAITTGFRPALVILFNLGSDLGNSNLVFLLARMPHNLSAQGTITAISVPPGCLLQTWAFSSRQRWRIQILITQAAPTGTWPSDKKKSPGPYGPGEMKTKA